MSQVQHGRSLLWVGSISFEPEMHILIASWPISLLLFFLLSIHFDAAASAHPSSATSCRSLPSMSTSPPCLDRSVDLFARDIQFHRRTASVLTLPPTSFRICTPRCGNSLFRRLSPSVIYICLKVTIAHSSNRWNDDHSSPGADEDLREQERIESNIHGFGSLSRRQSIKPIIAAVRGGAYGGGVEMLLNCDLVVADEKATFALPEVKRGVVAVQGGQCE